jgi:TolB protein
MSLKRTFRRLSLSTLILLAIAGCQLQDTVVGDRNETSSKRITVIDNPEKTKYEESIVDALVRLDDVRGMDWLDEEEIIVDRENRDFGTPEKAEGIEWYPHNIYVHSLVSGVQTPLLKANEFQGYAQVNPDRTKIFYKTFFLQANTGKGYLYDIPSHKAQSFTDIDAMDVQNGRWVDNESVVYATIDGKIYLASMGNSKPRLLLDSQILFVTNLAYMNGRLYYSPLEGDLHIKESKKKPQTSSVSNVVWMVPSPDEQRLAIVRRIKSGGMELLVTDLKGKILFAVAQDSQIFGTAWSPDGNKLAYAGITPNGTARGIYVADATTGLSVPLTVDVKFIADPLRWSPTGTRLMVSSTQPDDQSKLNRFVTFIVRVSGS